MERRRFLMTGLGGVGISSSRPSPTMSRAVRWQPDGAGTVARFGVLTPDFDPVPESEMWAMAPRGVSIHASRVARSGGSGAHFVDAPHIDEALDRLVELAPRAILLGYTSSSYALGVDADDQVRARLQQRAKGVPLVFTCPAAVAAFRLLSVDRISVVHPPWWTEQANEDGVLYWRAAGFQVVRCRRMEPVAVGSFREVAAAELFDFVSAHTPREAQAVFIGGNGLRATGAINALEAQLRMPVLSANQVVLWQALRDVRAERVTNYGQLFGRAR